MTNSIQCLNNSNIFIRLHNKDKYKLRVRPIFITLFLQINGNFQGITVLNLVIGCAEIEQRKLFLIAASRYPLNQQDKIKICGYRSDTNSTQDSFLLLRGIFHYCKSRSIGGLFLSLHLEKIFLADQLI